MSDTSQPAAGDAFGAYVEQLNQSFAEAFEQNMQLQTEFLDSWRTSLDDSALDTQAIESMTSVTHAYEVWMEAADAQYELLEESLRGEDVELEAFRDVWLNAANEAFKEVMGTAAFAAATGQTVGEMLEASEQLDHTAKETLQNFGFATSADLDEVGERLVELERRQHAIERKLDRVIDLQEDDQ